MRRLRPAVHLERRGAGVLSRAWPQRPPALRGLPRGLALAGGSAGAFVGMLLFRHKTSKPAFLIPFGLIVLLQLALILAWPLLREGL